MQNQRVMVNGSPDKANQAKSKNQKPKTVNTKPQINLANYPVVTLYKNEMTVAVQNILTDYNFRLENLSIETNLENATSSPAQLPAVNFEVLDTNNLRINFSFNPTAIKALSGRRLQFRIRDRERGDSDWYVIKQTFVRIPQIESVKCGSQSSQGYGVRGASQTNSLNQSSATQNSANTANLLLCQLRGEGLDYIAQVSLDCGRTWFPQSGTTLQVQPTEEGNLKMMIPLLVNPKFLQIKLRDYPNTEGLPVTNFTYSNTVTKAKLEAGKLESHKGQM